MVGIARRVVKAGALAWLFIYELVVSSVLVARDVLTPRSRARPGIIAVPLDVRSDIGITLLANLISLTPGSLTLDVAPDRRRMFVHMMFIGDPDADRRSIKRGFERRVREVLE